MCPVAVLDGSVHPVSIDAPLGEADDAGDDGFTLQHDALSAAGEGPDEAAGRIFDWNVVCETLTARHVRVLRNVADGYAASETAAGLGISRPRLTQLRRAVGKRVGEAWQTSDPLALLTTAKPGWRRHVAVARERRFCRARRDAESKKAG